MVAPIKVGRKMPAIKLKNQNGETINVSDFIGKKKVLIYFYPKASTPGCTVQAQGLRDMASKYKNRKIQIFGVSPDLPEKLKKFEEKEGLNFDLLSDPDHKIADKFGVWGEKKFMGKVYDGIHRMSFLIDLDGKVSHVMEKVKTKSHAQDILDLEKN